MPDTEQPKAAERADAGRSVLYVADVAKLRGISSSAARAWLVTLEKQHGDTVVRRIGRKLCTTERGLDRVLPGGTPDPGLARRMSSLERRVLRLTHRVQTLAAAIHDLHGRVIDHRAPHGGARRAGHLGETVGIDIA